MVARSMTTEPTTIVSLVPNWVGDVAMCTPALRALSTRFPNARHVVAGRAVACDLLRGLPYIHSCVNLPARASFAAMSAVAMPPGCEAPDWAVVFPHSFRAALQARLLGARHVLGYARGGRSLLLSKRVQPHRVEGAISPIYMTDEYLDLVKALGVLDDGLGLELTADAALVSEYRELLRHDAPVIGGAPGAAFGPSKLWPAERYANIVTRLSKELGAQVLLITGPGEESIRDEVLRHVRVPVAVLDDGSPSIAKLKAAISVLDLLIGNDSGTRHIAVAFKVPTVCIMGPTSPVYSTGPYERGTVLRIDVDCGPCQKPVCTTDHRCMTGISVDRVYQTVVELLTSRRSTTD